MYRGGEAAGKAGSCLGFAHLNSFKSHFLPAALTLEGAPASPERLVKTQNAGPHSQNFHSVYVGWVSRL